MAPTLQQTLLAPGTRPAVLADCYALIDQEVAAKSGVSGTAVKLAYKTVTSFAPEYFHNTVENMLPHMVDELEPYWADFSTSGGAEFGDYLGKRGEEVVGGAALADRRNGGLLRAAHNYQGVPRRTRRRRQAHPGRAAAGR